MADDDSKQDTASSPRARLAALAERITATPGASSLVLRAFLSVTFVFAGLQKLANPAFFNASSPTSFQAQLNDVMSTSPIASLLRLVNHAPVAIAVLIACGELAVGLGTTIGLLGRIAATGGLLLSLSFFLTISYSTSPYYFGSDIVFVFAWTPLILGGSGRFSVDELLRRRRLRELVELTPAMSREVVDRRAALRQLGVVGAVGIVAGSFAGLVAGIGHSIANGSPTADPGANLDPVSSDNSSAIPPSSRDSDKKKSGRKIASAAKVPVGGALAFTDPFQQIPAYLVRPTTDEYVAFSAICTHAGCTVGFNRATLQFDCPCHGSIFNAKTGAVIRGPAPRPLPSITISQSNGEIAAED